MKRNESSLEATEAQSEGDSNAELKPEMATAEATAEAKAEAKRAEENGVLQFHKGTEDKLAQYVQTHAKKGDAQSVVDTIDKFCMETHWMMNLGHVKGAIVDTAVQACNPTIVLELGTYCGYSAARLCQAAKAKEKSAFKYYTIDPEPQAAAQIILEQAGLSDKVVHLRGAGKDVIPTLATKYGLEAKVDFVFIDHDKKAYLADLILIENAGLLHPGSVVVADNVLIFHIDEYLRHVKECGLYKSDATHSSYLEYDLESKIIDGVNVAIYGGKTEL